MEPTQAKPPRNRRRRLIVASVFVLVLVSIISWWYWPRGDARFVGKWTSQHSNQGYWHLRSNGVAVWHTASPGTPSAYTTWRVQDNVLSFEAWPIVRNDAWRTWIIHQWNNSLPFNKWITGKTSFRVLAVEPDKLLLQNDVFVADDSMTSDSTTSGETETLTRIPE